MNVVRFLRYCTIVLMITIGQPVTAEISEEQVNRSMERAIGFLRSSQSNRGSWGDGLAAPPGGVTCLCTLALLNCNVPQDDPVMVKALDFVRNLSVHRTYSVALQTMVLCTASPNISRPRIRQNVKWLENNQVRTREYNGGWGYGEQSQKADNSNSQFAVLALYEAERAGVEVSERVWNRARDYWINQQHADGAWSYDPSKNEKIKSLTVKSGSMTCAGIACVMISSAYAGRSDDENLKRGEVKCCQEQKNIDAVELGLAWLGKNFSARRNPVPRDMPTSPWWLYYMYAMERVGRLSGQRFIGSHDWYREGVEELLKRQEPVSGIWQEHSPPVGTSLALLFLSKGRRPVLISKLKRATKDWDSHPRGVGLLTSHVENRWQQTMTWQTIDISAATADDLLTTPVLFISGSDSLNFSEEQVENLRTYILQGGFIFAEAACGGKDFDESFRNLIGQLLPESELRVLPPSHPVWYAEQKVDPQFIEKRPLLGVEACCRTSIVYCQGDLSCYWGVSSNRDREKYTDNARREIDTCMAIGANVVTYATNRELRGKLDTPQVLATNDLSDLQRATLQVAKLTHNGGGDDAPAALSNLLRTSQRVLQIRVNDKKQLLPLTHAELPDFPIAFMHGRRDFKWTKNERAALVDFVENGGFLLADAICASPDFAKAFRRELKLAFPKQTLRRITSDHPIFSEAFHGFDISTVRLRDPVSRRKDDRLEIRAEIVPPNLEALEMNGRIVVVFSPYDLSCALENQVSLECKGYPRDDAAKIGMNILLFAMQQ